jgi:hypothetical protein
MQCPGSGPHYYSEFYSIHFTYMHGCSRSRCVFVLVAVATRQTQGATRNALLLMVRIPSGLIHGHVIALEGYILKIHSYYLGK